MYTIKDMAGTPVNLQDQFHSMLNSLRTATPAAAPATAFAPPSIPSAVPTPVVPTNVPATAPVPLPPPPSTKRVFARGDTTSTVSQKCRVGSFFKMHWGKIMAIVVVVIIITVFIIRTALLKRKQKREEKKKQEEAEQIQWENYFEGGSPSPGTMQALKNKVKEGNRNSHLMEGQNRNYQAPAPPETISIPHRPSRLSPPAGSMMPPAGSMMQPAGSMMPPAGSMMPPAGSMMQPAGSMMPPRRENFSTKTVAAPTQRLNPAYSHPPTRSTQQTEPANPLATRIPAQTSLPPLPRPAQTSLPPLPKPGLAGTLNNAPQPPIDSTRPPPRSAQINDRESEKEVEAKMPPPDIDERGTAVGQKK
jgi:uncharacterized membrane protein